MANNLFQQLNPQQTNQSLQNNSLLDNIRQAKQMANMIKNKPNQQQIMQMLAQQNPQLNQIMNLINMNGGNAKALFMQQARQMGINPEEILNQLR